MADSSQNSQKLIGVRVFDSAGSSSLDCEIELGGALISCHQEDGKFQAIVLENLGTNLSAMKDFLSRIKSDEISKKIELRVVGGSLMLGTLGRELEGLGFSIAKKVIRSKSFSVHFDPSYGKIQISAEDDRDKLNALAPRDPFQGRKIRVLIVDDSEPICALLEKIIHTDSQMVVVGRCGLPSKVPQLIEDLKPDVITMDIYMPEMDGVALVKKIHPKYQVPIVMISSVSKEEGPMVLEALDHGAFDYIQKPSLRPLQELAETIVPRLKQAAASIPPSMLKHEAPVEKLLMPWSKDHFIAIGSSTGGTEALKRLLMCFPDQIPPVVVAQHIPPVFSDALARRLNGYVKFEVKEAKDGDLLQPNLVLIAPGGLDMKVVRVTNGLSVKITDSDSKYRHHPSVDYLFDSVATECGSRSIGVILTGMGSDGALGMLNLKKTGAWNVAQDESSCVVFGMPKEAIAKGGVDVVAHLDDIAAKIDAKLRK